ncbi:MAG TPA: hypothetical protein VIV11_05925 [Kofleriaceae bacterium]
MSEPKEIAKQVPSDNAILRRYSDAIAKSPFDIKRGEAVLIDRHGIALGRGRVKRIVTAWRIGIYGALIGSAVLVLSGSLLPGVLLYLVGITPTLRASYRGTGRLMAIDVIVRQGHLEEGQRRFDEVPHLRRRSPVIYCWIAGNLASHRGDYAGAIKWWREGLPRADGIIAEVMKLSVIKALALSGQIKEALLSFDAVKLPPEADPLFTGQILARVILGLHEPETMPPPDELHDLARTALAYSHTGVELAAIGWAFERSGEDDMARLLASEAVERMHYPYLATWWPALQQWLDGRNTTPDPTLEPDSTLESKP